MKLKICGMKNPQNIIEVAALLPDFMGFIFWEKSPRFFTGTLPELPKSIKKVGVFVDATLEEIQFEISKHDLDLIQLHGNESPIFCRQLQEQNIPVIKAFAIDAHFDLEWLSPYEHVTDYYLFDTKGPNPGGNGQQFDWNILKDYKSQKPVFLSGGIDIESMEALKNLHFPLFAIDVNSRFETDPGLKSTSLLHQFKSQLP